MIFSELISKIEKYIRLESLELRYQLKDFVNEAIEEFLRLYNWRQCIQYATFSTTGADSYDLVTILSGFPFYGEIDLIRDGKNDTEKYFQKVDYTEYIKTSDKSHIWTIHNGYLYREGTDEDLTLVYLTPGLQYPLVADDDENFVTLYYSDIIIRAAVVKYHIWYGATDIAGVENQVLQNKIQSQKKKENRDQKEGRPFLITTLNR